MTPLEAMAKAHWNIQCDEFNQWDELDADEKAEAMAPMRAALLALAEVDVAVHAASVSGPSAMRVYQDDRIGIFRAMLQSIAKQS